MDQDDGSEAKARPLGRGLEDVSHLFLSSSSRTGDGSARAGAAIPAPVPLRPVPVTRDRLGELLPLDWSGALEEGLRTIDVRVPCHPCGEIDVLAVDRAGKLTVIDFEATVHDGLLLRGLGHVDWVGRNAPGIQRMCLTHGVDFALSPRLILMAPQFSPQLRRAMRQLTRPQISWVRYHAVEAPTGIGILFEPITGE